MAYKEGYVNTFSFLCSLHVPNPTSNILSIKLVHQVRIAPQHRSLVDIILVRHFSSVKSGWLRQNGKFDNTLAAARFVLVMFLQNGAEQGNNFGHVEKASVGGMLG